MKKTLSIRLSKLSDCATEAHIRIQRKFDNLDPIIGINQGMRDTGIPADIMTIDCLRSGKRIILILHDQQPDELSYQFSFKAKDPSGKFNTIKLSELNADVLYEWIHRYFLTNE